MSTSCAVALLARGCRFMTDRKQIALYHLRLAQEDLVRASTLVTARIQLAYDYGATEHDIMHTLRTEGG